MNEPAGQRMAGRDLRKFGLIMAAMVVSFFGLLIPWIWGLGWPIWPWAVGIGFAAVAMLYPSALRPVHRLWERIGLVLSWVNTRILLGAVFYFVVTPIGLIVRLLSDPMARRLDENVQSYRKLSEQPKIHNLERPF